MSEFRKVHQFNCFTVFTPAQYALAEYLKSEDAYLSLAPFIQKKRDYVYNTALNSLKDKDGGYVNYLKSFFNSEIKAIEFAELQLKMSISDQIALSYEKLFKDYEMQIKIRDRIIKNIPLYTAKKIWPESTAKHQPE